MFPGRSRTRLPRWTEVAAAGVALVASGCDTRDRLTFPTPGTPGTGPETVIEQPAGDTTVAAGPGFFVTGFTRDADGLDTVYFETEGGVSQFPPFAPDADSIRFALPLTTQGQSGQVIVVRVFGTDRLGVRGDTATRQVAVF
jgi:hypothetical protein